MKPILSKVNPHTENLLSVVERCEPYFTNVFHFHEECELVYVTEGHGKRIIGNNIAHFDKGDIVFVGANLPHVWYNDKEYFTGDPELKARSIVIYFPQNIFGHAFYQMEETRKLNDFFLRAQRGIHLYGETQKRVARQMTDLLGKQGLNRVIGLLHILECFSETKEYHYLADIGYSHDFQPRDNQKIDKVFRYVISHYHRPITLDEIAAITQLTPQSFCRFFRNRTSKSFIRFVNEIRVGQACRKLAEEEWSVSEIAYACGFSNLSNFNRFFKEITGKTPRAYRQEVWIKQR